MNTKQLIATLVTVLAASAAQAQSTPSAGAKPAAAAPAAKQPPSQAAPAGLTRAEVIAAMLEARKNGLIPETEADFDVAQTRKHIAR